MLCLLILFLLPHYWDFTSYSKLLHEWYEENVALNMNQCSIIFYLTKRSSLKRPAVHKGIGLCYILKHLKGVDNKVMRYCWWFGISKLLLCFTGRVPWKRTKINNHINNIPDYQPAAAEKDVGSGIMDEFMLFLALKGRTQRVKLNKCL